MFVNRALKVISLYDIQLFMVTSPNFVCTIQTANPLLFHVENSCITHTLTYRPIKMDFMHTLKISTVNINHTLTMQANLYICRMQMFICILYRYIVCMNKNFFEIRIFLRCQLVCMYSEMCLCIYNTSYLFQEKPKI